MVLSNYKAKQQAHRRIIFGCHRCNKPFAVIHNGKMTSALRSTPRPLIAQCGECAYQTGRGLGIGWKRKKEIRDEIKRRKKLKV